MEEPTKKVLRRFRTAPRCRITNYKAYAFYNKKKIPKKHRVENWKEYKAIINAIFKKVAEKVVETEGGVVLDRFGYIGNWMTPKKIIFRSPRKDGLKLNPNYHTDGYFYVTSLFTTVFKKNYLKGWSMDKMFNKDNIKKPRGRYLKSGRKYKFYYSFIKGLFNRRKYRE